MALQVVVNREVARGAVGIIDLMNKGLRPCQGLLKCGNY